MRGREGDKKLGTDKNETERERKAMTLRQNRNCESEGGGK